MRRSEPAVHGKRSEREVVGVRETGISEVYM